MLSYLLSYLIVRAQILRASFPGYNPVLSKPRREAPSTRQEDGACDRDRVRCVFDFGRQTCRRRYFDVGVRSEGVRGLSFRTRLDEDSR